MATPPDRQTFVLCIRSFHLVHWIAGLSPRSPVKPFNASLREASFRVLHFSNRFRLSKCTPLTNNSLGVCLDILLCAGCYVSSYCPIDISSVLFILVMMLVLCVSKLCVVLWHVVLNKVVCMCKQQWCYLAIFACSYTFILLSTGLVRSECYCSC